MEGGHIMQNMTLGTPNQEAVVKPEGGDLMLM